MAQRQQQAHMERMQAERLQERQLQEVVMQLIRAMGQLGYHTYDSRRSTPGFPDLVIVGGRGVLYRELKTHKGKLADRQKYWLQALRDAGEDADVWRPDDWPDRITRELRELGPVRIAAPEPSQAELRKKLMRGMGGAVGGQ